MALEDEKSTPKGFVIVDLLKGQHHLIKNDVRAVIPKCWLGKSTGANGETKDFAKFLKPPYSAETLKMLQAMMKDDTKRPPVDWPFFSCEFYTDTVFGSYIYLWFIYL